VISVEKCCKTCYINTLFIVNEHCLRTGMSEIDLIEEIAHTGTY
jgi:hypothetical protein